MTNVIYISLMIPVLSKGFEIDVENNSIIPDSENNNGALDLPIFKCDKDGVTPNPRSCRSYIKCSHHHRYVVPCKEGYHFRNETGQCELACEAYCDQSLAYMNNLALLSSSWGCEPSLLTDRAVVGSLAMETIR
ncbi:uncharacterized protein NPIL_499711 [Nephila pilipes]|uniref:Chitin-binding type-2 domain-containing protein n=1 Tax=Nephila pilipes TaxID=299642 RepID=A0A8X6P0Y0_NEPPI|nr:uncharacterized protein NPIL_499711 [Nephila pilipes]